MAIVMSERCQFLWGAGSIVTWLLTFLFVSGYYDSASSLKMHFLHRNVQRGDGFPHWNEHFAVDMNLTAGLDAAGCSSVDAAPICACLNESIWVAESKCLAVGRTKMQKCFMLERHVQTIVIRDDWIRPYMQLLMVNLWAALVGAVFLVRGKLVDKGSYAVQLLLQGVLLALTVGCMWLSFGASVGEWLTLLSVSIALVVFGWIAEDDDSWAAFQFHLLYTATLPGMWVIYCAYNHRLDTLFFSVTALLTVVLALVSAGRACFERLSDPGYNVVFWCSAVAAFLVMVLVFLTLDTSGRGILDSATYAWIVVVIYLIKSTAGLNAVGGTMCVELLLRVVLSAAMIKELFF